ncbi:MAG TPA: hypothetical protein VHU80_03545 [Polyangiaceae bacterium]|jgi:hypothetical protein|nr:hypothetical protein [Polyangiaceae bacterium]
MARWRQAVSAMVVVPLAVSCASILGIEKAEQEPAKSEDAGGGAGGDSADHPSALCADYCAKAIANCTGDFELYPSLSFCLAVCKALPPGTRTDITGNTVGCRLHLAESAAAIEKSFNCSAAGPGGNGVCGDNCDSWCTIEAAICPTIYASNDDCLTACRTFPVLGTYNDTLPTQSGNSFECRLYHVTAAAGIDPNFHCPHTDIDLKNGPCSAK